LPVNRKWGREKGYDAESNPQKKGDGTVKPLLAAGTCQPFNKKQKEYCPENVSWVEIENASHVGKTQGRSIQTLEKFLQEKEGGSVNRPGIVPWWSGLRSSRTLLGKDIVVGAQVEKI